MASLMDYYASKFFNHEPVPDAPGAAYNDMMTNQQDPGLNALYRLRMASDPTSTDPQPASPVNPSIQDKISQMIGSMNSDKGSFFDSPLVALAAGLFDNAGKSTGEALSQGLVGAMNVRKAQQAQDIQRLHYLAYLSDVSGRGDNKSVWVTNSKTNQKAQVPMATAQRMVAESPDWVLGEPVNTKSTNLQHVQREMTIEDARRINPNYKGTGTTVTQFGTFDPSTGQTVWDPDSMVGKKDAGAIAPKPPTGTDLMRSRSIARRLLGVPESGIFTQLPGNTKVAQQGEDIVKLATQLHKNAGYEGNVTDFVEEALRMKAAEWKQQGLSYGWQTNNPSGTNPPTPKKSGL